MVADHCLNGIGHCSRVYCNEGLLADSMFPDQDMVVLHLRMVFQQSLQDVQRKLWRIYRQYQAVRGLYRLKGSVKTGQGTAVRIDIPYGLNIRALRGIAGDIALFNPQSMGLVQHMLQK